MPADIFPGPVDRFLNLNDFWNLKRFSTTPIELILKFFNLNFSIILNLRSAKHILKASFLKFCLQENIVLSFISLTAKLELYNIFSFQGRAFQK